MCRLWLPQAMIGPTLEAVVDWLAGTSAGDVYAQPDGGELVADYTDADHFGATNRGSGSSGDLATLFSNLTMGLWSSVVGSGPVPAAGGRAPARAAAARRTPAITAPADSCMGVVLHLFVDSPQVCLQATLLCPLLR
jgi:hypothetical protein